MERDPTMQCVPIAVFAVTSIRKGDCPSGKKTSKYHFGGIRATVGLTLDMSLTPPMSQATPCSNAVHTGQLRGMDAEMEKTEDNEEEDEAALRNRGTCSSESCAPFCAARAVTNNVRRFVRHARSSEPCVRLCARLAVL